jgi:RHS repeat-associated protein
MTKKSVDGSVTSYVYNTEDRLTEVWSGEVGSGSLTATYYYDPFGRRLWKEVDGARTYFHYADEGLVGEYDNGGVEIKNYGYKPGSTWTTDPLFMKVGSEYYFYHNDHLGTPQKMTSVNGAVVWGAKYSSFGKAEIDPASTITNNLRFPGQYYDVETMLNCNWYRYYNPTIGRYLKVDPIGIAGGINRFVYASINPINRIDPFGLLDGRLLIDTSKAGAYLFAHTLMQGGIEGAGIVWTGAEIGESFHMMLQKENDVAASKEELLEYLLNVALWAGAETVELGSFALELLSSALKESLNDCEAKKRAEELLMLIRNLRIEAGNDSNLFRDRINSFIARGTRPVTLITENRRENSNVGTLNKTIIAEEYAKFVVGVGRLTKSEK